MDRLDPRVPHTIPAPFLQVGIAEGVFTFVPHGSNVAMAQAIRVPSMTQNGMVTKKVGKPLGVSRILRAISEPLQWMEEILWMIAKSCITLVETLQIPVQNFATIQRMFDIPFNI